MCIHVYLVLHFRQGKSFAIAGSYFGQLVRNFTVRYLACNDHVANLAFCHGYEWSNGACSDGVSSVVCNGGCRKLYLYSCLEFSISTTR